MRQVVKVRLLPTPEQASALLATLHTCNEAATWLSEQMHRDRVWHKIDAQKRWYRGLRDWFGLSAQPTVRVIGKVAEAYATVRANLRAGNYGPTGSARRRKVADKPVRFRSDAAQPFDARCLSWQLPEHGCAGTVSIWTVAGRVRDLRLVGSPAQLVLLRGGTIGETDLICRDGMWFLHAAIDVQEAPLREPDGFLGVDLGIINIATTSDGHRSCGSHLNRYRARQRRLRQRLQVKKTSSARRLLKKRRRREARFAADVNHRISKRIVAEAQRTERGIAVEDLTGIRGRVRLRKPQRATLHAWAFAQLGQYLQYKAARSGVAFVQVDPAYTSQTCNRCGHIDKKSRRSQALFVCGRCGFVGHADHNAARNIATRGVVRWGEVMRPDAAPTLAASQGGSSNPSERPGRRGQATSLSAEGRVLDSYFSDCSQRGFSHG
ncbi:MULTISPECIES: transposase [unclassified Crossiella]|uniref:RNA-guided endonuclease InsQ/TnpB family protein n=1 Tax=unclassified Crossiella TaxID=2620835 RepID=UPI001FFED8D1|nr:MULTISPECIES: transposase [unclassified Crossiella]MCK2243974.1 transposase [Crossiella sp. S99.2]MCK2257168.1 transposase [Crossiella sp. S99.1]